MSSSRLTNRWEEQHLCLLSWSVKKPRRAFWDWEKGKPASCVRLGHAKLGPMREWDGWKRTGDSSRVSVLEGCMPQCHDWVGFQYPWCCACPACGAVLFQLGGLLLPAVLLRQHWPDLQSSSSNLGWPGDSLPPPVAGQLQHARELLIPEEKDPGALGAKHVLHPAGLSCCHMCRKSRAGQWSWCRTWSPSVMGNC